MNDELFVEDFNEEKAQALSNFTGTEVDYVGNNEFNADGATYVVYTEEEAREAALDLEKSLIDDMGLRLFSDNFRERILNDPSLFDTTVIDEIIESEISYFTEEEPDAEVAEALSNMSEAQKFSYVKDLLGPEGFEELVSDNLNVEALTDVVISEDGFGPLLASYDGEENELENDLLAFRIS